MKVVGIIAEYNPFHKGHEYQIRYAREILGADYIVIAMSGDFVQRGAPALMEKHLRAEMALLGGADLILEMPVQTATASAEGFAAGGVSLLDGLGVVDELCFGSECGDTETLMNIAQILIKEPFEYRKLLQQNLRTGMSFPAARSSALIGYIQKKIASGLNTLGTSSEHIELVLSSPNNILGIEYCKALLRLNSQIRPVTIRREGMGYHETAVPEGDSASSSPDLQSSTDFFASATAIRSLIQNPGGGHSEAISDINNPVRNPDTKTANILSSQIPPDAFYVFKKALDSGEFLTENSLDSILSYCLMKENVESLSSYMDVSEDLARRIINQQNLLLSFSQSVSVLKTRELTQTRIQRALLHIILNIHTAPTQIPFARVLGFRRESSELLSQIKQHSRIPLITKLADAQNLLDSEGNQILSETVFSSNLYEKLLCLKTGRKFCHESQKQLIIL